MFDTWYDGPHHSSSGDTSLGPLGPEYLVGDSGLTHGGTPTGGTAQLRGSTPAPTLVGSAGGLQFDLIWDSSVASAPSGFMQAVIDAATYFMTLFSTDAVINIHVGWGEIAGQSLSRGALGESESYGNFANYSAVASALTSGGYSPSAGNEPTTSQFFVTTAEEKAFGWISGTSTSTDGYIGFGTLSHTGYSWNFNATSTAGYNSGIGSNQFDLEAVAWHEISEVMGRIGMEGATMNGAQTYTPLDLFNFHSAGVLQLSGSGGHFSTNNGSTPLGNFNNATTNGGDIADWASNASPTAQSGTTMPALPSGNYSDAFDAFAWPGYNGVVSQSDIQELAALGYTLTPAGVATA
jgi:hypothetical protein